MFGYALDPDTSAPTRVAINIEGVGNFPLDATLPWDGVEQRHPGYGRNHSFLFGRTLPRGTRSVCTVALDANGGPSSTIGCFRVTVK